MHAIWHDMFGLELPLLEKILRPLIVYVFLVIGLRLAGKHQLAQLNPFDLIVLLTLSNTLQNAIIGADNSVSGGVIGAVALLAINYVVVRFLFSHRRLEQFVEGDPDALIERGILHEERLKKELLTREELETAAHRQGFTSLDEVQEAVIEPGGTLYFVAKKPPVSEVKQAELRHRLDRISQQLADIRQAMKAGR